MVGISILDSGKEGQLSFDLCDILQIIRSDVLASRWTILYVECVGPSAEEVHSLSDKHVSTSGATLLRLAASVTQTIEGTFSGYRAGDKRPWIVIRAVDGSAFDVETEDADILSRLRSHFCNTLDLPK